METLEMSGVERKRLEVFSRVKSGQVRLANTSEILGISYRQTKRICLRQFKKPLLTAYFRYRGAPTCPCDVPFSLSRSSAACF